MSNSTAFLSRLLAVAVMGVGSACSTSMSSTSTGTTDGMTAGASSDAAARHAKYSSVRLAPDLAPLSGNERKRIPLLVDAKGIPVDIVYEQ